MILAILGMIIGLIFIAFGLTLIVKRKRFVTALLNYKYKGETKYEAPQNAIIFTLIMGILVVIAGLYYFVVALLSFISYF